MSRKITDAIKKIIKKAKSVTEKANENDEYTIGGDTTAIAWLKYLKIVNHIRLFPDFYGAWAVYENTIYLVLVNYESSSIPKFLEEETLNAGAWVAILDELDLPLKQDIDISLLEELLDSSWNLNQEFKEIIFDQDNNGYSFKDFFPNVYLYKIASKFTRPEELHQILGLVLVQGINCKLLPYSEDVIKEFEKIFDNGDKNIPFDNLLASYVASDFKFAYLDIYRCIEKLQPLYFFKEFHKKLSLNNKSLLEFCQEFYKTTGLEPSLSNSLEKLLESVKRVPIKSIPIIIWQLLIYFIENDFIVGIMFILLYKSSIKSNVKDFKFYNIRNQIVHLRPNQTNDLIPEEITKWNELILNILIIVKKLYSQNTDLFSMYSTKMTNTIILNPLEQSTKKIVDLLTQITQDYQQILQQDTTSLLENFPPNNHEFSILEEIDLLTTDLRGYASQININQQIKNPDQTLTELRAIRILANSSLAELYFTKNKQFPLIYQYLQNLDYLKLLLIDWLMLQE